MTMTTHEIRDYVLKYLEVTKCSVLEQSPYHVTVKLSPEADRALTGRPYYWAFVDRVQVEPETMTFSFVFDSQNFEAWEEQNARKKKIESLSPEEDPLLSRHFGAVRPLPVLGPGRVQKDHLFFGSPRLNQIFAAAQRGGGYIYVFEKPNRLQRSTLLPAAYEPWLGVCYKVEFACDLKRQEIHFYGVSLVRGTIDTQFEVRLTNISMIPRLPENIHITPTSLTLAEGRDSLENQLRSYLESLDSTWASEARQRQKEELSILESYYKTLDQEDDEAAHQVAQEQYEARQAEIRWQYEPRIMVSAINCGIFHLRSGIYSNSEYSR